MLSASELQQVKQRFGIIGVDEGLNRAIDVAVQVANTDLSVLVTGESGVGKENIPRIIHNYSARKHSTFIAVNCGAIPEGTIDSELFGHEKGAFTGAISDRKGYFEEANGGTIFLDEIGEMPMATQARLLRVLEAGEFIKVGSSKVLKTNVRVIAATNVNLPKAIENGLFREDLYYRLNTVPIYIPPLRDRKVDIPMLFRKFAADFAEKNKMPGVRLTDDAQQLLMQFSWPGNIRQLKNVAEQISILSEAREVTADMLLPYIKPLSQERSLVLVDDNAGSAAGANGGKWTESEREVLYQILFDMRKEINDLKQLLNKAVGKTIVPETDVDVDLSRFSTLHPAESLHFSSGESNTDSGTVAPSVVVNNGFSSSSKINNNATVDTDVFLEPENRTIEEMQKEMIKKSLERNGGNRKLAADELKISERTLYRKIKKFGLDI